MWFLNGIWMHRLTWNPIPDRIPPSQALDQFRNPWTAWTVIHNVYCTCGAYKVQLYPIKLQHRTSSHPPLYSRPEPICRRPGDKSQSPSTGQPGCRPTQLVPEGARPGRPRRPGIRLVENPAAATKAEDAAGCLPGRRGLGPAEDNSTQAARPTRRRLAAPHEHAEQIGAPRGRQAEHAPCPCTRWRCAGPAGRPRPGHSQAPAMYRTLAVRPGPGLTDLYPPKPDCKSTPCKCRARARRARERSSASAPL